MAERNFRGFFSLLSRRFILLMESILFILEKLPKRVKLADYVCPPISRHEPGCVCVRERKRETERRPRLARRN